MLIASQLYKNHIESLVITNEHAFLAGQLPMYHKDPFDRMLVAQAQIESLGVVTNDPILKRYDVDVIW